MSRTIAIAAAVCALCFAFIPSAAIAQTRHRVWFGLGAGPGSGSVECDVCSSDRETAPVGVFRIGVNLNARVLVGGEFSLWTRDYTLEGVSQALNLYHASAAVTYYPRATGFFVRGGIGGAFANVTIDSPRTSVTMDIGRGLAVMGGAGYDAPFARRWSVTPAVGFSYGRLGDSEFDGETLGRFRQNVVDFTVSLTFR